MTSPQVPRELRLDVGQALGQLRLAQLTGGPPVSVVVTVKVERMETLAISQYSLQQTEPLALLKFNNQLHSVDWNTLP